MYRDKKVALVIPAYNEEGLIGSTLDKVPDLIDKIYVVDDRSTDRTAELVRQRAAADGRLTLIEHERNRGPGGSIISGYLRSAEDGNDLTVVVGGDDQMPLDVVTDLLDPVIDGKCDYAKGNRFHHIGPTLEKMPKIRLVGNMIITALTKLCSGYYKIMDVVDGYTCISRQAIKVINWEKAWPGYGYPMNFLVHLNAHGFKVVDVPRRPIYLDGVQQSKIKGLSYALKVSPMLVRAFFWRILYRYLYRDFHPLVFFYFLGLILLSVGMIAGLVLIIRQFSGVGVSGPQAIFTALCIITGLQFLLFAMFFDMQEGR
ncbi:MAG: glycosyltransferase family 2 protein [Deltaproteobacteria bacterium]|nr:glycosyltransferase family 2 protein [Deltaproteobacteria bacterium]